MFGRVARNRRKRLEVINARNRKSKNVPDDFVLLIVVDSVSFLLGLSAERTRRIQLSDTAAVGVYRENKNR